MLTIGQLAAYAGVTVRTVRHYHQIGLLPEPERDASGYRRYGASAAVALIKIRTVADAGVPLSQIGLMLQADADALADAVEKIDNDLREEIERLELSRKRIAQLAAGDALVLPSEVICYLDRLRELGVSPRILEGERDGWILLAARWPEHMPAVIADKLAELEDPQLVRLYRVLSEVGDSSADDESRLAEIADLMAGLLDRAYAAGEPDLGTEWQDEMPFDLMNNLAAEADPRMPRIVELMRERGWDGWTRLKRVDQGAPGAATRPPGPRSAPAGHR
ncbi:MerR family transcriptional regulator [Actinoplanes sp. NPDC048791]|uniref:MerR family transcriptional regulator n=1 Tax=Actinoplanes sp. NPDC048791 TaxID=3154623 RepID=UPI0033C27798